MLKGNLCEHCGGKVEPVKARHKQTKYCEACAKIRKRENTLDPWTPEKRRDYMRTYMREYRAQERLGCLILFLPFLGIDGLSPSAFTFSFESIEAGIAYIELLAVKVTGLAFVVSLCYQHLKHLWKDKGK